MTREAGVILFFRGWLADDYLVDNQKSKRDTTNITTNSTARGINADKEDTSLVRTMEAMMS